MEKIVLEGVSHTEATAEALKHSRLNQGIFVNIILWDEDFDVVEGDAEREVYASYLNGKKLESPQASVKKSKKSTINKSTNNMKITNGSTATKTAVKTAVKSVTNGKAEAEKNAAKLPAAKDAAKNVVTPAAKTATKTATKTAEPEVKTKKPVSKTGVTPSVNKNVKPEAKTNGKDAKKKEPSERKLNLKVVEGEKKNLTVQQILDLIKKGHKVYRQSNPNSDGIYIAKRLQNYADKTKVIPSVIAAKK